MNHKINIDGKRMDLASHRKYRGAGMVSGNNSSRLLLDYKRECPEQYWEILEHIFGERGVGVTHLKLEMGSDINSSSGTEPAIKRTVDEAADITRGMGYQLAADAKRINPALSLDMLWWSEPAWISAAEDIYHARYQWYKETLAAAYEKYGLVFDYISASQNEREIDLEWIKYLSEKIKTDRETPYDFGRIKIIASDEDNKWNIADAMIADEELRDAIDVVGTHYTSFSSDAAKKLSREYGKEIFMSEASAPMCYSAGRHPVTGKGIEMPGINGVLDIANRMVAMYPCGDMTLYEFQPVVSAYYDGVSYCQKQLITANEPWNGSYFLDSGYYMSLHFSQFIKKGWNFLPDACCCDGKKGGDGHAMVDVQKSYLSAMHSEMGDYSVVIVNPTAESITYEFTVKNTEAVSKPVAVWQTRAAEQGEEYGQNYFKNIGTIVPELNDSDCREINAPRQDENAVRHFSVVVAPESLTTISTIVVHEGDYSCQLLENTAPMPLPYRDDFSYDRYGRDYLQEFGNAPRYMTDQGGAFEVVELPDGERALCQKITPGLRAKEWGATPEPTTNFGDDRWFNYSVSVDVAFDSRNNGNIRKYAGVGLRYRLAAQGVSGYGLLLYDDGTWQLKFNDVVLEEGRSQIGDGGTGHWHTLRLEAEENLLRAYLGNSLLAQRECGREEMQAAGRAALYSSYNCNLFRNVNVEPMAGKNISVKRWDDMDSFIHYEGEWEHETIGGFMNYRRTLSTGYKGAALEFVFQGTGFMITGSGEHGGSIRAEIDGQTAEDAVSASVNHARGVSFAQFGIKNGEHRVRIEVSDGLWYVDSVEVLSSGS